MLQVWFTNYLLNVTENLPKKHHNDMKQLIFNDIDCRT